jgi:hypothetical protein
MVSKPIALRSKYLKETKMTQSTETRFHLNREMDCQDAADILGAISYLLNEAAWSPSEPDSKFQGQLEMPYRDVHGLTLIIDSIAGGLVAMQDETDDQIQELRERYPAFASDIPQEAYNSESLRKAWRGGYKAALVATENDETTKPSIEIKTGGEGDIYPKVAELTARELAIKETYNQGYPVEEIAKAVNLKKVTVQNVIDTLKEKGSITIEPEPNNLSHATNG